MVTFRASGVDGAGFQGFVAASPAGDGVVLCCADVAGVHRSTNWGQTWTTTSGWAYNTNHLKVAGLAWSTENPNIVVIFTGNEGSSPGGGVWVSTDNGVTFTQKASSPTFAGGNVSQTGLPGTHPRSTGRVGVIDYSRDLLYVGSYSSGVYRASFDPSTGVLGSFTAIGSTSGLFIRSIAVDQANNQLFVACHDEATTGDDGVFLITSASSSPSTATKIAGAPQNAEELLYLDNRVYAVAGGPTTRGVFSCSTATPSTWTERSGGLPVSTPRWQALDGYVDASANHVLYVGCDSPTTGTPTGGGTAGNAIYRCDNAKLASPTWTSLTFLSDANTPRVPLGQSAEWWLMQDEEFNAVNRGGFDCAALSIGFIGGTGTPDYLFAAGRAGVWRLDDPLASGSGLNGDWHPAVDGLAVTITRAVAPDPTRTGTAYIAIVDWLAAVTTDSGDSIDQIDPGVGNACYTVAVDPTSGTAVLGTGDRDNNALGRVYTRSTPGGSWSNTNIHGDGSNNRIMGVAAATVGSSLVLLAARMEAATGGADPADITGTGGLWRKVGAGSWTQLLSPAVNGVMDNQGSKEAPFSWPDQGTGTGQTVYWYERANGVWRSTNDGASWTRIWATTSNSEASGYVSADPTNVARLYISQGGNLYTASNAGSVSADSLSPSNITPSGGTGRISAIYCDHRGIIWACGDRDSTHQPQLWVSGNQGSTWTDIADDRYRQAALFPYNLAVGPDGEAYLALNGNGVLVTEGAIDTVTAAMTASGAMTTDPRQVVEPTATPSGAGTLTASGTVEVSPVTTVVSGISRERGSGCATLVELTSVPPYGSGGEGVSPVEGTATFTGSGDAATEWTIVLEPTASFVGSGQAQATAGSDIAATATFTGSGLANGQVEVVVLPTATVVGSGTLTVQIPTQDMALTAGLAGAGTMSTDPTVIVLPTTAFSGTGSIGLAGAGEVQASASFTGTGLADGQVTLTVNTATGLAGTGGLTVQIPTQDIQASASFSGTGHATATVVGSEPRDTVFASASWHAQSRLTVGRYR